MEVTLRDMLLARENRVSKQQELLSKFQKPLICFTMNIPGPVKNSPAIAGGFRLGLERLNAQLLGEGITILHKETVCGHTGCEAYFVADAPAEVLKRLCVEIEEADALGRLFDLDVLTPQGQKIQRSAPRKCLLCQQSAQVCGRSRAHSVESLQAATHRILEEALGTEKRQRIAAAAVQALLCEVAVTPKPGLVDRDNPGSHRDMDIFTFLGSASVLQPYFERCAGLQTLEQLRYPGKLAESAMFRQTGGVNTHKGAIFSLGLLCCAAGQADPTPEAILQTVSKLAAGITGELGHRSDTAGQRLYGAWGITGIRGQAEQGFPAVLHTGLPVLRQGLERGLSLNDAAAVTLLHLFTVCQDTNCICRGGFDTWQQRVQQVKDLLEQESFPPVSRIWELDRQFIRENLSPGGSADLLSLTLFLHFFCD